MNKRTCFGFTFQKSPDSGINAITPKQKEALLHVSLSCTELQMPLVGSTHQSDDESYPPICVLYFSGDSKAFSSAGLASLILKNQPPS